ncbi:hypothetical protein lerEdw1_006914 [Lerista edwardsae]|nr:hypothetical protein lerEdw1_006914 [Lerista edwardsae]
MSAGHSTVSPTPPENKEADQQAPQNVVSRVANLPLVSSTYDMVSSAYASTKETHPYLKSVCDVAEKGVKTITAAAVGGAQPLLTKLEPQIADTKELVSTKVNGARSVVSSTVNGAKDVVSRVVDLGKGAMHGSMEMTRSVVAGGMNTVMGSRVGQMVATGVDTVLGKSEELVDRYLPLTDQELAELATCAEGFEMATVEQQKKQQSYFVRLGSLSSKLRHRAYQHSVDKLKTAKKSTQDALAQLHQTIELIEHVKQGVDQKLQGGQEKLHQMCLEWSRTQTGSDEQSNPSAQLEVESRTLVMFRGLTRQLQHSCQTLMSSVHGLPASIQDTVQQVRHTVEDLHSSFSTAHSFQDVPATILAQSRERIAKARNSMDEMLDYVVQNVPLPWLVGPFAPNLVELPEVPCADGEKAEGGLQDEPNPKADSPKQESSEPKQDL